MGEEKGGVLVLRSWTRLLDPTTYSTPKPALEEATLTSSSIAASGESGVGPDVARWAAPVARPVLGVGAAAGAGAGGVAGGGVSVGVAGAAGAAGSAGAGVVAAVGPATRRPAPECVLVTWNP
jgi:hypothetical protein